MTFTHWSHEHDELLWEMAREGKSKRAVGEAVGRTKNAVTWRAKYLGCSFKRDIDWTPEEDALLCEHAVAGKTRSEVSAILKRTFGAIKQRAIKLRIRFIPADGPPEVARALGVRFRKRGRNEWSLQDDSLLRSLVADGYTLKSCASYVHRSVKATAFRATRLGLRFADKPMRPPSPWDDTLDAAAKSMWLRNVPARMIAKHLGHGLTKNAVIGRMNRLHAKRPKKPAKKQAPVKRIRRKPAQPIEVTVAGRPALAYPATPFVLTDIKAMRMAEKKLPTFLVPANDVARVPLEELQGRHCRWIVGDPKQVPRDAPLFCGHDRHPGLAYCPRHAARAFHRVSEAPHQVFMDDKLTA